MRRRTERQLFEEAGLVDDETGELERSPSLDLVMEHETYGFTVDNGHLLWVEYGGDTYDVIQTRPSRGMLRDFLKLASPSVRDEQILAYARRWNSPLGLCAGRKTAAMTSDVCMGCTIAAGNGLDDLHAIICYPSHDIGTRQSREALRFWRLYARLARAILLHAHSLSQEEEGRLDCQLFIQEWMRSLFETTKSEELSEIPTTVKTWRRSEWATSRESTEFVLSLAINTWLEVGRVRFDFVIQQGNPTIKITGSGVYGGYQLLGALGLLLMQSIARTQVPAFCHNCGTLFFPTRKPVAGRNTYCEDPACKAAAAALHTRASRARKRAITDQ